MKLAEIKGTVERGGVEAESGFKIAATAKAFEILSSKLYTDVPRAIVRELSTNAHDAHVEAGHADKPFDVHLPGWLEPWFEIRDFGPGLSPEAVKTIYTVYFASTRNESDAYAGCLGLGSKSPFAYTDSFTVTSYINGVAYIYSLFKNEKQEPSIALLGQNPTTEPNGVAIRISIKSNDHSLFNQAASRVYRYFKVKPNIKGGTIDVSKKPSIASGDGYELRSSGDYGDSSILIVMGQVCYKVGQINLRDKGFNYNAQVEINVNIGDCATAASREELHMDERTKKLIEKKLDDVVEDITAKMKDEMAKCVTTLEKVCIQNRYGNINDNLRRHIRLNGDEAGKYTIRSIHVRRDRKGRKVLSVNNHPSDFSGHRSVDEVTIIEDDSGVDDLPLKMRGKLSHWILSNQTPTSFFLAKIHDLASFEANFGKVATKLTAMPDVPKAQHIPGVTMERNKSCIRSLAPGGDWNNVDTFVEDEGYALVLREGNKVVYNGVEYKTDILTRMMNFCGISTVYGIPTRVMKKYDGELRDIFEICKEKVEEKLAELTEYEIATLKQPSYRNINRDLIKKLAHLGDTCKDAAEFVKAGHALNDRETILLLANFFGVQVVDKPDYVDILMQKYPMLSHFESGYLSDVNATAKELEIYIKAKGV